MKTAFKDASLAKQTGPVLNRLMHKEVHTAKRVRTKTSVFSEENGNYCESELQKAHAIIEDETGTFMQWLTEFDLRPSICQLIERHGRKQPNLFRNTSYSAFRVPLL